MVVLDLRFCARAFSSCGRRGPLFIAVRGPLTVAASLVAEYRLQTRRLTTTLFLLSVSPAPNSLFFERKHGLSRQIRFYFLISSDLISYSSVCL